MIRKWNGDHLEEFTLERALTCWNTARERESFCQGLPRDTEGPLVGEITKGMFTTKLAYEIISLGKKICNFSGSLLLWIIGHNRFL